MTAAVLDCRSRLKQKCFTVKPSSKPETPSANEHVIGLNAVNQNETG
jgi:hypothetical protein